MEGTTAEERLEEPWRDEWGQFCGAEWGVGVACSQVQRPESSWHGVGSGGQPEAQEFGGEPEQTWFVQRGWCSEASSMLGTYSA